MKAHLPTLCQFFSDFFGSKASATHLSDGRNHTVSVSNLRVLVYEEHPGVWTAQCIDVDYVASGESSGSAKLNFERGLTGTLKAHLEKFGTLDRFFKRPPIDEWLGQIGRGREYDLSLITEHEISADAPIRSLITYIEQKLAA